MFETLNANEFQTDLKEDGKEIPCLKVDPSSEEPFLRLKILRVYLSKSCVRLSELKPGIARHNQASPPHTHTHTGLHGAKYTGKEQCSGSGSVSFGPPRSGSISQRYGSRCFHQQEKLVKKTFISTVL
jgi:hypothetical protein